MKSKSVTRQNYETLSWRLGAYEQALEWVQSSDYQRLNARYRNEMKMTYGAEADLGLCYFFANHLWVQNVYSEIAFLFPELNNNRTTDALNSYLATSLDERIEMLFKAIDEVKFKLSKNIQI
jgi:hypothetical protein